MESKPDCKRHSSSELVVRWLKPDVAESAGRLLVEGLEIACVEAGAAQAWAMSRRSHDRYELQASLGCDSPSKVEFLFQVSGGDESFQKLRRPKLTGICPFPDTIEAVLYHRRGHLICVASDTLLSSQRLDLLFLVLERLQLEVEVSQLRKATVQSKPVIENPSAANAIIPEAAFDSEEPELSDSGIVDEESEPIQSWYRVAANTLASGQLASVLPSLTKRLLAATGLPFAAILIYEDRRLRLWGAESLRELLGPVFSVRKLGSLGRRVVEGGEIFVSAQEGDKLEKNQVFGQQLGLKTLVGYPLRTKEHHIGAVFVGDLQQRDISSETMESIALASEQTSLFVDQALSRHAVDVERVVSKAVLESMADGVYTMDFEKRITSFNPAAEQITGWKAEQAIGRTCEEVFRAQYLCPGADADLKKQPRSCREHCPLVALLGDQKLMDSGLTVEGSILTADGETRYVSSTYSVVSQKEDLLGAVVLFRDITEKRAFEQMKSDYAAALSHDLKTPLTAMKGYAVTLLRHGTKLDAETRQDALEVINSEIDRVTRMFDNLLHQARIEAGQHARFIEGIALHAAVKRVVNVHQLSSRRHRLTFEVQESATIRADRDQLDQILNNLVSNAVKYSPQGCEIHVSAQEEGRMIRVSVRDTGAGIAADQLPFVFERFRRVQDRMSRNVSGSGLGLYITRMLVEGMEGEVGAESTPGQGSNFWFQLPVDRK
jgi:signal transduction histidine kinase